MTKTPAFLILSLGLLLLLGASALRAAVIPKVGEPAPNFTLRTLDDRASN